MFIVGKSFFSETLSKFNIKTIAPLSVIHIPFYKGSFPDFSNSAYTFWRPKYPNYDLNTQIMSLSQNYPLVGDFK